MYKNVFEKQINNSFAVVGCEEIFATKENEEYYASIMNRTYDVKEGDFFKLNMVVRDANNNTFKYSMNGEKLDMVLPYFSGDCRDTDRDYLFNNQKDIQLSILSYLKDNVKSTHPEMASVSKKILESYEALTTLESQSQGKAFEYFIPSVQETISIRPFDNEWYFVSGPTYIDNDDSLLKIACQIVNSEKLQMREIEDKDALKRYFVENIADIWNESYDTLNENQREAMSFFSDWHKDVYGFRPRETKIGFSLADIEHSMDDMDDKEY